MKCVKINEMPEMKDDIDYNLEFHYSKKYETIDIYVAAEIVDNKAYFVFNQEKLEIPINNIKKIYFLCDDYSNKFVFYFLTVKGEMYKFEENNSSPILDYTFYENKIKNKEELNKKIIEQLNKIIENITKINNKIKYEKLLILDYGNPFSF